MKITFSYLWTGNEDHALKQIAADFNKSQSKITVVAVSAPDSQKQLTSMSSSNGSFDLSDNFGSSVGSWASKGIIAPLDDLLKADGVAVGSFAPAAMSQMSYKGKIYSMPIAVHTQALLYNKDLLAAAGVQPPKTIDELSAAVKKLTKTDANGKITQLGLDMAEGSDQLTEIAQAFGGKWDGADNNTPTPTDPKNIEALNWYKSNVLDPFGADKITAFRSGFTDYFSAADPFYTGKDAMLIDGEWQSVNAGKFAPKSLKWGVIPFPAVTPQLANSTQVSTSTLFIPSNSKHKEEAAKFLAYLMSDKSLLRFNLDLGNIPPKTSLLADKSFSALPGFTVWSKLLASPNAKALSSAPYSAQYQTDLANALDNFTHGKASASAALQSVQDRVKTYGAVG